MTLNCNNINLRIGSKGETVREAQKLLHTLKYYNGKIDGEYGSLTEKAVKAFQKTQKGLAIDGVLGPVTCKHLNNSQITNGYNYYSNGIYHGGPYWVGTGCNKMGQCNGYFCAPCTMRQQLTKNGIEQYLQAKLASYAGTTTAGTSHYGIETALAQVAKETGKTIKVEWKNFSDFGRTVKERFENIGKLLIKDDTGILWHTLYQDRYGHYESVQEINMNNLTCLVLNSLGSRCGSPVYCGRKETRSFSELARNLAGISQKSICIITIH